MNHDASDLSDASLAKCNLTQVELVGTNFHRTTMTDTVFSKARVDNSDWRGARFKGACNFSDTAIRHCISLAELKAGGLVQGLKTTGYSLEEIKAAGYSLEEIKAAGYSLKEAKAAGHSLEAIKAAGYTAREARDAGFTPEEGFRAGYSKWETSRDNDGAAPWEWKVGR